MTDKSRRPGFQLDLSPLLEYSDWERSQWHAWFREQGPVALAVGLGPNGDGRIGTIGELVRHIFSAEQRYVDRIQGTPLTDTVAAPADDIEALFGFGRRTRESLRALLAALPTSQWDVPQEIKIGTRSRSVTPRKMVWQAVTHEIRHWAQVATFLRMSGRNPGPHDLLVSPVFDKADPAAPR
jgi:uncharacterized damage-inducible protein DinB